MSNAKTAGDCFKETANVERTTINQAPEAAAANYRHQNVAIAKPKHVQRIPRRKASARASRRRS
jgi:hypothetical protein